METNFLIGTGIGTILFLIVAFLLMCYFVFSKPFRKGGPIFFVRAMENVIFHIKLGDIFTGKHVFLSKKEYIEKGTGDIKKYSENENPKKSNSQISILGMVWIGFPGIHSVHFRHQQWTEWKQTEKGREVRFRDEMTPILMVKPFEYVMSVEEAEDKNDIPLSMRFTVTLKPTNADKPVFGNDNAYGQVQTFCIKQAEMFIKEKSFSSFGDENEKSSEILLDEFSTMMTSLNKKIPGREDKLGLIDVLGYEIQSAKFESPKISGPLAKEIVAVTLKKYTAEENSKALIIESKAKRDSNILLSEGEKAVLEVKEKFYKNIAYIPGAMEVEKLGKVPNLTTYVEGENQKSKIVLSIK